MTINGSDVPGRRPRGPSGAHQPYQRRSDDRWLIQIEVADADGRRRRYVSGKTPAEARRKLSKLIVEVESGQPSAARHRRQRGATLAEVLEAWLKQTKLSNAPQTYDSYLLQARHLAPLHDRVVTEATKGEINDYLLGLGRHGLSPRTVNYNLRCLKIALNYGVRESMLPYNPAANAQALVTQYHEAVPFDPEDVRRILAGAPTSWQGIWTALFGTGMRIGECLGVRRQDWGDSGLLTISQQVRRVPTSLRAELGGEGTEIAAPKTQAGIRRIRPADFAADLFEELCKRAPRRDSLLFTLQKGGRISPRDANRRLHWVEQACGVEIELPPHSARHTVASQLIAGGANLDDVRRYLGHRTIAHTSELYGHWIEARTRELGASLTLRLMPEYNALTSAMADGLADEVVLKPSEDSQ